MGVLLFLLVLVRTVIPAEGMGFGGFDISVDTGDAGDFTLEWQDNSAGEISTGDWEEPVNGEISTGGWEEPVNGEISTGGWEEPVNGEEIIWEQEEEKWQPFPEENTQETGQEPGQIVGSGESQEYQGYSAGDMISDRYSQNQENGGTSEETGLEHSEQNDTQGSVSDNSKAFQEKDRKTSQGLPKKLPAETPADPPITPPVKKTEEEKDTKKTSKKRAEKASEKARKKDNKISPTPAPVLSFFRRGTDSAGEKAPLQVYYKNEIFDSCDLPRLRIDSQSSVHVLSVRINKKECPWHWEGCLLVPEVSGKNKENSIELIALYEKGAGMSAVFVEGAKETR